MLVKTSLTDLSDGTVLEFRAFSELFDLLGLDEDHAALVVAILGVRVSSILLEEPSDLLRVRLEFNIEFEKSSLHHFKNIS